MRAALANLVFRGRDLGLEARQLDELEWIVSRGGSRSDRHGLRGGGFAVFRSARGDTDAEAIVTAHFRSKHASYSHYHPDDTGIEIYGYGSQLVLGPGMHGYDSADPYVAYQVCAASETTWSLSTAFDGVHDNEYPLDGHVIRRSSRWHLACSQRCECDRASLY